MKYLLLLLLFPLSACAETLKEFAISGTTYQIVQEAHPDPAWAGYHRLELHAHGLPVVLRDYTWDDVREDIYPDPIDYVLSSLAAFNRHLEQFHTELTYDEKVAKLVKERVDLVGSKLELR